MQTSAVSVSSAHRFSGKLCAMKCRTVLPHLSPSTPIATQPDPDNEADLLAIAAMLCTAVQRLDARIESRRGTLGASRRRTSRSSATTGASPHVYGKTDADAVFGLIYAQAEDDFNRVETNFINSMGRLAEAEGEARDLARPAHEAVHRSRQHEGEVRGEPGVAQDADERLGRRPELLSRTSIPR